MKKNETFTERVCFIVKKIPRGKFTTYVEIAKRIGSPKFTRAVGVVLSKNLDKNIPCHRVLRSDGDIGSCNPGGIKAKKSLLAKEGVLFKKNLVYNIDI